jgi:hypothetical protein
MGEFLTNTHTTGAVIQADEHMQNYADTGWNKYITGTNVNKAGLIAHSATVASLVDNAGDIFITADGGETWAATAGTGATTMSGNCLIRKCKADSTLGFACETGVTPQDSVITIDSGTTWTNCTADPATATAVYDVSFSTAALIVIGGDDNVGVKHIVFGAVAAGNVASWTDMTSGPSDKVYALDMFDANNGFCVDSSNNIWITANGAVDWTDTGVNIGGTAGAGDTMHCFNATSFIYNGSAVLQLYSTAGGISTITTGFGQFIEPAGIIELTNGNIVTGYHSVTAGNPGTILFMTDDNGTTWFSKYVTGGATATNTDSLKCSLTEFGSNNIGLILNSSQAIKIFGGTDNT